MGSANIQDLYNEWQKAVQALTALMRDARLRGLTPEEIDELAAVYVLRIDAAFARLKRAEAEQAAASAACRIFNPASEEARSTA
jgi:hypothetical protein